MARNDDYTEVRTEDGRIGWVINSDLSASAPPPQEVYTFGLTAQRKADEVQPAEVPHEQLVAARTVAVPAPAPPLPEAQPASLITNVNVMKMQGDHSGPMKSSQRLALRAAISIRHRREFTG